MSLIFYGGLISRFIIFHISTQAKMRSGHDILSTIMLNHLNHFQEVEKVGAERDGLREELIALEQGNNIIF